MKNKILILILIIFLPLNIYAYSNKIIVGGETIGIEIKSNGIYVVGFYPVNNKYIAKESGFKIGDIIKKIDNENIVDINNLNNIIKSSKEYVFELERDNKIVTIKMNLEEHDNLVQTGLYVKDTINGIGTLSYIDPETKVFASLGHDIIETSSNKTFNIKEGNIYKAEVTTIIKSKKNITGEKNANIDKSEIKGIINKNEITGIYGIYNDLENNNNLTEVAKKEEIKQGEAKIRTVISSNEIKEYKIKIISIDEQDPVKNILFEIEDKELLNKTGGIIQGMSGSPIIQNDKIIGVVNYVIINDEKKGYGIFITTMLEEGDKINS